MYPGSRRRALNPSPGIVGADFTLACNSCMLLAYLLITAFLKFGGKHQIWGTLKSQVATAATGESSWQRHVVTAVLLAPASPAAVPPGG